MDRAEIVQNLKTLGERLAARGIQAEVYVVGGAALALAYDARRATRDVDAVFAPKEEVYRAAREVAADLGLPEGWLNDAVKGFLTGPDPEAMPVLDVPGLRVLAASPRFLLAMKCLAARREDEEDIRFLLAHLGVRSAAEAVDLVLSVYPEARLPARSRFMLEEIFGAAGDAPRRPAGPL